MKSSILILFLAISHSCSPEMNQETRINEDVSFLASDALEGRQTGTKVEKKAAAYISKRFKEIGIQPKGTQNYLQPFSFKPKTNPHDEVKFDVNRDGTTTGNNVVGFFRQPG